MKSVGKGRGALGKWACKRERERERERELLKSKFLSCGMTTEISKTSNKTDVRVGDGLELVIKGRGDRRTR